MTSTKVKNTFLLITIFISHSFQLNERILQCESVEVQSKVQMCTRSNYHVNMWSIDRDDIVLEYDSDDDDDDNNRFAIHTLRRNDALNSSCLLGPLVGGAC